MNKPVLLVMAGPNGSGKSTITSEFEPIGTYVNADMIKKHLKCSDLEAAQIAEATRERLLNDEQNFTFESVLSTTRNYNLMRRAREKGYIVICIYVLTCDPNINVKRVHIRKEKGGHFVPEDKVISRYHRALSLFPLLFDVCNELYVYDNSIDREMKISYKPIIQFVNGSLELFPNDIWSEKMLNSLCQGSYSKE